MIKILKVVRLFLTNIVWIIFLIGGIFYALLWSYNTYKMVEAQAKVIELPGWIKKTKARSTKDLPQVIDGRR